MNFTKALCGGIAFCLTLGTGTAFAQELSLTDVLSGGRVALVLRPTDIPDDYRAVKITSSSGTAGMGDMLNGGNMLTMLMAMGAGNTMGTPAELFLEIWPITWTKGELVRVVGQDYVVTYGMDISPMTLRGMDVNKKLPPFNLKLKLVRASEMGSIQPLPEWSKERYLRAVVQITNQPKGVASGKPTKHDQQVTADAGASQGEASIPPPPVMTSEPSDVRSSLPEAKHQVKPEAEKPAGAPDAGHTVVKAETAARPVDAAIAKLSAENAKSIASAMLLYAQDYDETFPYVQSSRGADYVIFPYVKGTDTFKTNNPDHPGDFRFNMSLGGVSMAEVENPGDVPLFFDPYVWPDGTYLIAFADSHVSFISASQWDALRKNLNLKLRRKGSPLPANLGLPGMKTEDK